MPRNKHLVADAQRRQGTAASIADTLNRHCGAELGDLSFAYAYARHGRVELHLPARATPEQIGVLLELAKKLGL